MGLQVRDEREGSHYETTLYSSWFDGWDGRNNGCFSGELEELPPPIMLSTSINVLRICFKWVLCK